MTTATKTEFPVLSFSAGLIGLAAAQHFILVRVDDDGESGLFTLCCLEDPAVQLVVADPGRFFPSYTPELDDTACRRIDLTDADDALVLIVLNVGEDAADTTGNLLAPLVVHRRTLVCEQAVLTDGRWGTQVPLGT